MSLLKSEKRMWPILELSVKQIDKDGRKVRNGAGWMTWKQREIRKMLPKHIRSHFGLGVLLLALSAAGCATPSAGTATSPVTAHLCIDGSQSGPVTATLTVTITPTSTAKQDAKADGKVDLSVPVK